MHPTLRKVDFIPASEALVRADWKYMFWPKQEYEQFFDLTQDPPEENDLAKDPAHATRLTVDPAQYASKFPHDIFAKGGTLELELGPQPNPAWGIE